MSKSSQAAERPLDLNRLLQTLADHGVDYVVIGGIAVQVHGHRRTTMDLDLVPRRSEENLKRLASALEELEAQPHDAPPREPQPLSTRHGQLHILNEPKGARPFDRLRDSALVVEIDGIEIPIAGLDDLIRMKRASGRPADLEDVAALLALEGQADESDGLGG